jgi:hypothetical protein
MRSTLLKLILMLALGFNVTSAWSQTYFLSVDSVVGIPDTIVNGQVVSFTMFLTNQSTLVFQGGVDVILEFPGTSDSLIADSAALGNGFLAPQSQTQVFVTHQFTTEGNNAMVIGDNVVVVWPKIAAGPAEPAQEVTKFFTTSFYLMEPLSIWDKGKIAVKPLMMFPNPAQDEVRLALPVHEELAHAEVTDALGRLVLAAGRQELLNTRMLPAGLYTVTVQCSSGAVYRGRLLVR